MEDDDKLITRIIFAIKKDDFNDAILDIIVNGDKINNHLMKLNKTNTINNINVYENLCNIKWDGKSVIIKLSNNPFNNWLTGYGKIYIIGDDVDYNHVNDICGNLYHPKNYEVPYSVYCSFHKKCAITLFVDPLKYPELVSLVLFEFLKLNDYTQDIKNCILSLYNDV